MQYRTLGKTGWSVSAVAMGCWNIGGQWGAVTEDAAHATVRAALDAGVNLFDTADIYGLTPGVSETLLGRALEGVRDRVLIATKCGYYKGVPFDSWLHVKLCCEASLYRLRTDRIDLLQCHIGHAGDVQAGVFLEAFARLKERGMIRACGVSTNRLDVLRRFADAGACDTCQFDYSLLNRDPERDLIPYCRERNVGTLVRGALARGLLSGRFTPDTRFEDAVRDEWNRGAGRERFLGQLQDVERLRYLEADRPLAQAAVQFALADPAVSCVVAGARTPGQIAETAAASDGALSPEELAKLPPPPPPRPAGGAGLASTIRRGLRWARSLAR